MAKMPQNIEAFGVPALTDGASLLTSAKNSGVTDLLGGGGLTDILSSLRDVQQAFTNTSGGLIRTVSTIFGGLFSFFLIVILSFYFAMQETGVDDFIRLVAPVKHQAYALDLWRRSHMKIGLWMQGQILLSVLIGVLIYLGLAIIGVRYALVLGLLAALFELVPVFGSFVAAVPAIAVAFVDGGTSLGFLVTGLYLIVNQFQSNLIYPLVVKKIVGVPPLLVILALIAGAQLAGFLGVIIAVPLAAAMQEFVSDIQRRKQRELERMSSPA
jgi:predicted PurR-regulated permease PerM